jgi:hypothetical protein
MSEERKCPSCGFDIGVEHRCVTRIDSGEIVRAQTLYDAGYTLFGLPVLERHDTEPESEPPTFGPLGVKP